MRDALCHPACCSFARIIGFDRAGCGAVLLVMVAVITIPFLITCLIHMAPFSRCSEGTGSQVTATTVAPRYSPCWDCLPLVPYCPLPLCSFPSFWAMFQSRKMNCEPLVFRWLPWMSGDGGTCHQACLQWRPLSLWVKAALSQHPNLLQVRWR